MNSGKYGQNGGTKAEALTFVVVGLNENDDYVYNNRNMVYDNTRPCPINCSNSALLTN